MTALVAVAEGCEDIETVTIVDVLRRAGVDVCVAAVGATPALRLARGCHLRADALLDEVDREFELIALPGGLPGAENLAASDTLATRLRRQRDAGRLYAAICAAPALVLAPLGLLDGLRATCYPSFRERLPLPSDERVVIDGPCITSQSPATAIDFSLALVEALRGGDLRREIAAQMLAA